MGDSYDNALAETVIGPFETELTRRRVPWRSLEAIGFATLEWVDWPNHRRLLAPTGHIPSAEAGSAYRGALETADMAASNSNKTAAAQPIAVRCRRVRTAFRHCSAERGRVFSLCIFNAIRRSPGMGYRE